MEASQATDLPTDAAIIARVRAGEQAAYAELIRRYQHRLRAALSLYFSSREEIEEHLQEAFVQAYLNLDKFDAAAPFYPWLKGIALNALKMEFRRLQTARRRGADYLRYLQLSRFEKDPEAADGETRCDALRRCMEKLPPPEMDLLVAKYAEDRPLSALAPRFGATEGALKVRLLRLRAALRSCIQKQLSQPDASEPRASASGL